MSFRFLAMRRRLSVSERLWTFLGWMLWTPKPLCVLLLEQDDMWLTAATVWEIGIRGLTGFREEILTLANSENRCYGKPRRSSGRGYPP